MRKWKWLFANGCETWSRARSEPGGTRWRTGGEVANGVSSQYSHATSERGLSSIIQADAHNSAASSRLNWRTHRFKWTPPFRGKTKSGFCACAITFRTSYNTGTSPVSPDLAPADFYLFSGLKGRRFCDFADIIRNATKELKMLSKMASRIVSNTFVVTNGTE